MQKYDIREFIVDNFKWLQESKEIWRHNEKPPQKALMKQPRILLQRHITMICIICSKGKSRCLDLYYLLVKQTLLPFFAIIHNFFFSFSNVAKSFLLEDLFLFIAIEFKVSSNKLPILSCYRKFEFISARLI